MKELGLEKIACILALFCLATAAASPAQTFTTLLSFEAHDDVPGSLSQGANGNLYSVSGYGGAYGQGAAFEVTPEGRLTNFYSFCSQTDCTDGSYPQVGPLLGANGNFYGTTYAGGNSTCMDVCGKGVVFELTLEGKLTVLHDFCLLARCADGSDPGVLIQAADGNLYGTTVYGGANSNDSAGGTLFQVTPTGKFTLLHSFCSQPNCTDGSNPNSVMQATNGNIYGTAYWGGTYNSGTAFVITPAGKFTTLHSFAATPGADFTTGPLELIEAADGNLYGATVFGGIYGGGTIFKITPTGKFSTLYNFCSQTGCTDGFGLNGLLQGPDGNFYGATGSGGLGIPGCGGVACGTLFKLTPQGKLTTLYSFCTALGCPDGQLPERLMLATNGILYGTTEAGGVEGFGTVFSFSVGFAPFVQPSPAFGGDGQVVQILGNNLTGTTSVTFNGTLATFRVETDSYVKATVPSGATTGKIEITTPSGTLSSNVAFQVLP